MLLIGPSLAGPFEDAVKAYESGDYKTAYRLFKQLAEKGDAHAQSKLGFLYEKGQGAPQDYAEAVKWYRTAAEKGNTLAQYNLGVLYEYGQGLPQDNAEAAKWYRKAAEQGYATAQSASCLVNDRQPWRSLCGSGTAWARNQRSRVSLWTPAILATSAVDNMLTVCRPKFCI